MALLLPSYPHCHSPFPPPPPFHQAPQVPSIMLLFLTSLPFFYPLCLSLSLSLTLSPSIPLCASQLLRCTTTDSPVLINSPCCLSLRVSCTSRSVCLSERGTCRTARFMKPLVVLTSRLLNTCEWPGCIMVRHCYLEDTDTCRQTRDGKKGNRIIHGSGVRVRPCLHVKTGRPRWA